MFHWSLEPVHPWEEIAVSSSPLGNRPSIVPRPIAMEFEILIMNY